MSALSKPAALVTEGARAVRTLAGAGVLKPRRPDKLARAAGALRRWGPSPAAGYASGAALRPNRTAISDELGSLSFAEVEDRTNRLASGLAGRGIGAGDGVALMMRNHRHFVEAVVACAKLGASSLFMNTMFSGPQLAEVAEREAPKALIYDEEFAELLEGVGDRDRIVGWHDGDVADDTVDDLIMGGSGEPPPPPEEPPRFIVLTSGTTGAPKGAQRRQPDSILPILGFLAKIPLRSEERTMIAAPMFHSWAFVNFSVSLLLGSTLVLRRRFDPEETLRAVAEQECTALVVVPIMMQRILALPEEVRARHDVSSLRVTGVSGSALPGELATEWMDAFGDNVYNLYGSTEVGWATIATPEELRAAPGTAGTPPPGTTVRILDESGREVTPGETGRIFVESELAFEGYTGGGGKEEVGDMLSTGDVGHLDEAGRLFVDGRDDEMIVSGGENVFPREVEDMIASMPEVEDVAVVGVEDPEWGQRLAAFVVRSGGSDLDPDAVKAHVKQNLASYKAPREVSFLEELPRNATGKVLKRELVESG